MFKNIVNYDPASKYHCDVKFVLMDDGYYETTINVFDEDNFVVGTVIIHEYEKLKPEAIKKIERLIIGINEKTKCL